GASRRGFTELPGDVRRAGAVGIHYLRRHALRQHVFGGRDRVGRRVTVNVDESRRDEEIGGVDLGRRARAREIADARDETAHDPDVRSIAWQASPVNDGATANDDFVRRPWWLRGQHEREHREREDSHASAKVNTDARLPSRSGNL